MGSKDGGDGRFGDPEERFLWAAEPSRLTMRDMDALLLHCVACEASDVTIKTGMPVVFKRHGRFHQATRKAITAPESLDALSAVFKSDAGAAQINSMKTLDFAYEIKVGRAERYRFRVNAGSCNFEGGSGAHLTMRPMRANPPSMADLGVEPGLMAAWASAKRGLSVVSGATGEGKSTLLAAMIRGMIEKPWADCKVMTIEDPIEFLFDDYATPSGFAVQTEIGKHCPNAYEGVRSCMRQNPSAILIGETRSPETLDACLWAATSGQLAMTTLHASGVASTLRRMVSFYPEREQATKSVEVAEALCLVVSQRLVPSMDGRRVALREYLSIEGEVKEALLGCPVSKIAKVGREMLAKHGQSFMAAAKRAYSVDKTISKAALDRTLADLAREG